MILLLLGGCISRLSRPIITGVIVDDDHRPVASCSVGETVTAADGTFRLPEKRYRKFFLPELMIMEAPPLWVREAIVKEGFDPDYISIFSRFGGGQGKGAQYRMDTIYLREKGQQVDVKTLLSNTQWQWSTTQNADTVYMIREGFRDWCKTERCSLFYRKYETLTDHSYSGHANHLPDGVLRRNITVYFGADKSIDLQQTDYYKSTFEGPDKIPNTLRVKGSRELRGNTILQLDIKQMPLMSGRYQLAEADRYQLMMVRIK